jgi:hypothetical protein
VIVLRSCLVIVCTRRRVLVIAAFVLMIRVVNVCFALCCLPLIVCRERFVESANSVNCHAGATETGAQESRNRRAGGHAHVVISATV